VRGDAVTLVDLVGKITVLEVACRRLDTATASSARRCNRCGC